MNLRPYQERCIAEILSAWQAHRSVYAELCTSAGKTIIAAKLTQTLLQNSTTPPLPRVLYLADTDELVTQPLHKFHRAAGIFAVVDKGETRASRNARVVIASVQTLARDQRLRRYSPDHFQYIICDESHRGAHLKKHVTDYFASAKVLGLTATAWRPNGDDLSAFYEACCFRITVDDLIRDGYIVPVEVQDFPVNLDLVNVKQNSAGDDFDTTDLARAIRPYFRAIALQLKKQIFSNENTLNPRQKRHVVAFLPLCDSSREFVRHCRDVGLRAEHIQGDDPDREYKLKQFADRQLDVISCSQLLTTGWDCDAADTLLNLRPTRSPVLYRQMAGRILRTIPGLVDKIDTAAGRRHAIAQSAKPTATILDVLTRCRFALSGPAEFLNAGKHQPDQPLAARKKLPVPSTHPFPFVAQCKSTAKISTRLVKNEDRLIESINVAAAAGPDGTSSDLFLDELRNKYGTTMSDQNLETLATVLSAAR